MTVIAPPDVVWALVTYLRSVLEVAALAGTRISGEIQDSWDPMPRGAVLLRKSGGPPSDRETRQAFQRIDVHCYGASGLNADRLWATVHNALVPGQERRASIRSSGCLIYWVDQESQPNTTREADTNWPVSLSSYIVTYSEVPIS